MQREVVRDFLNLPGIVGVALIDGRTRPYFFGVDQTLNFQQKEALVQGIRHVVETTPGDVESFEFQFTDYQVYIYKLEYDVILLVLADDTLVYADYLIVVNQLKGSLQSDISRAIATFRLLASQVTLSSQSLRKPPLDHKPTEVPLNLVELRTTSHVGSNGHYAAVSTPSVPNGRRHLPPLDLPPPSSKEQLPDLPTAKPPIPPKPPTILLADLLAAMNALSEFTTHYLGNAVITNYWKTSRPAQPWLKNIDIDRAAHLMLVESATKSLGEAVNPEQHQWLREWVKAFMERCTKVIRDFSTLVAQSTMSDHHKSLLL